MTELENKIRETLPRLKSLTKGCLFTDKNKIIEYEVLGFSADGRLSATYFNKFKISWNYNVDKFRIKYDTIGHPIKLNDVLEYLVLKECKQIKFDIGEKLHIYGYYWNLSSVFLADQNEELINFLNTL